MDTFKLLIFELEARSKIPGERCILYLNSHNMQKVYETPALYITLEFLTD